MMLLSNNHAHFNPATAGATVALDARFLTGFADGDAVGTWTGRAGTSINPTEATNKPSYKVGGINGQPTVRTDGVNDVLSATATGSTTVYSLVALIAWDSGQGSGTFRIASTYGDGSGSATLWLGQNTGTGRSTASHSAPANDLSSSVSDSNPHLFAVVVDSGTITFWLDGTYIGASSTNVSARSGDGFQIGYYPGLGLYFKGDYGAVSLLPGVAMPAALRRRIEQSLAFSFRVACA